MINCLKPFISVPIFSGLDNTMSSWKTRLWSRKFKGMGYFLIVLKF